MTLEQVRLRLKEDARAGRVEEEFTTMVWLVAHEMKWTLEYVLNLEIWRFWQVYDEIEEYYKRQEKTMRGTIKPKITLR